MFERYDDGARRAVVFAQEEAHRRGHDAVGTEHLLLGLLSQRDSAAVQVLDGLGVPLAALTQRLVRAQADRPPGEGPAGHLPLRRDTKDVLERSLREVLTLRDRYVGTEHLLIALLRVGESPSADALTATGVDADRVRDQLGRAPRGHLAHLGLVRPRGDLGVLRVLGRLERRLEGRVGASARTMVGRLRSVRQLHPLRRAGTVAGRASTVGTVRTVKTWTRRVRPPRG